MRMHWLYISGKIQLVAHLSRVYVFTCYFVFLDIINIIQMIPYVHFLRSFCSCLHFAKFREDVLSGS